MGRDIHVMTSIGHYIHHESLLLHTSMGCTHKAMRDVHSSEKAMRDVHSSENVIRVRSQRKDGVITGYLVMCHFQ